MIKYHLLRQQVRYMKFVDKKIEYKSLSKFCDKNIYLIILSLFFDLFLVGAEKIFLKIT